MTKSRKKLFFENIIIYGLGSVMNMVIPFIMLPIISRLLPGSEYYGVNDTVTIIVSFGSAIAVMGLYDAIYRFYFDKEDILYRKKLCSSTFFTVVFTGFIASLISIIFQSSLSKLIFSDVSYSPLIIIGGLNIWASSINTIVAAPTRMNNQRLRYIIIQTLVPISSYCIAILLIIRGEYVYALPLAALISNIVVCFIFLLLNRHHFDIRKYSVTLLKPLLRFGVPLMPVFIFYWVLSSVGRIVITNTWGLDYTGIYAAAGKIAAISQLIYSGFAGGWQYFAFSTMKDKDYVELIARVFDYLSGISFFATSLLVLLIRPIFAIMLPSSYVDGIVVAPALFLAPLLLMLRQTIGMHFQVKKWNILGTFTIGFGALVAITLYYLLIPSIGISGAAIGSLIGYVASLLLTIGILLKRKLLIIYKRVYLGSVLTTVLLSLHMNEVNTLIVNIVAVVVCIILFSAYYNDIMHLGKGLYRSLFNHKNSDN